MKNKKRALLAGVACLCLLASMLFSGISVLAEDDLANYDKTTYVAPTRLWGADSVGDVDGIGTRWIYESAQDKDGNYVAMERVQDTDQPTDGAVYSDGCAQLESLWGNGYLYLNVGYYGGSRDIAQTFVAPADGYITTDAANVERKYAMEENGYEASAELAIFLNDKKIWPADDTWAEIGNATTPNNKLTVPALDQIAVKAGDKLRFVVNMGKNYNYDDRIQWPVAVNMYTEKEGEHLHSYDNDFDTDCNVCGAERVTEHVYTYDFDTDCNVCGGIRDVYAPVIGVTNSVSENVNGLAFLFEADLAGFAAKFGTANEADYTNATYKGYKLIESGVTATNGIVETTIEGELMYDLDEDGKALFAYRIINIPADKLDVEITMVPYYVIEIDGVVTTINGEAQTASYNAVAA